MNKRESNLIKKQLVERYENGGLSPIGSTIDYGPISISVLHIDKEYVFGFWHSKRYPQYKNYFYVRMQKLKNDYSFYQNKLGRFRLSDFLKP